jgi:hypothetical protein
VKKQLGKGHSKCYYEELPSVVRASLADFLLTIAEEEQRIERQRQSLSKCLGFEPYAAFSRLDRSSAGFLTGK